MWKCIRCEKENKDTAEICTECGHGRTMDYVQHRTLSKISAKLAKNWKISRNTEKEIKKLNNENRKKIQDLKKKYRQTQLQAKKDATKETPNENRKNAEEVIQKKLSSLRSSVAFMKDEISKEQDEINGLHVVVEEQNKLIEKDIKADKKADKKATNEKTVTLRISNWEEYLDEGDWDEEDTIDLESGDIIGENSMVEDFEDWYYETYGIHVKVEYSTYGTNEDLYNMLTLGDTYDLICPSEYMIMKLTGTSVRAFFRYFRSGELLY